MPGFGADPFGKSSFGHWDWSRHTFYESLPTLYREEDKDNGFILKRFVEGFGRSFNSARHEIRNLPILRDPEEVRTQFQGLTNLRLGHVVEPEDTPEQRGVFGKISISREFSDSSARFVAGDLGKRLRLSGSTIKSNNRTVRIASVIGATVVETHPILVEDSGPLRWELLPKPEDAPDEIEIEVQFGDLDDVRPGWVLSDGRANFEIKSRNLFRTRYDDLNQKPLDRTGGDGGIDPDGKFLSFVADFTQRDVGKVLTILSSRIPENNTPTRVVKVLTSSLIEVDAVLKEDVGPIEWAIRRIPTVIIKSRRPPAGIVEQSGIDLRVDTVENDIVEDLLRDDFTSSEVGKLFLIRGSSLGNDGVYTIVEYISRTRVRLDSVLAVEEDLAWEVRTSSFYSDFLSVFVRPSSLIRRLARDFGIEVDTTENEFYQRGWVKNVSQWIGIKGSLRSYEIVGMLSGFEVEPQALYRLDPFSYPGVVSEDIFVLVSNESGKFGLDGSLNISESELVFTSPTAFFVATDVSKVIRIRNSGSGNDGFYGLAEVLDSKTLVFRADFTAIVPDLNNGTLDWALCQIYTTLAPTRPRFDDLDVEMMEEYVEALGDPDKVFGIDKFCWEPDFYASMEVDLVDTVEVSPRIWKVTVRDKEIVPGIVGTAAVVQDFKFWKFVDGTGLDLFLESDPEEVLGSSPREFTFSVRLPFAPEPGPSNPFLQYVCPELTSCGFCRSNKIRLLITEGDGVLYGDNREAAFRRVLGRIRNVTPAHVEFFPVLQINFEANLNLEAETEVHVIF